MVSGLNVVITNYKTQIVVVHHLQKYNDQQF